MWKVLCLLACCISIAACGRSSSLGQGSQPSSGAHASNSFQIQLIAGLPGWSYSPINSISHNQNVITQFMTQVQTFKPVTGVYPCPFDNGYHLHLVQLDSMGRSVFIGEVSITGCQFLTFEVPQRHQSYWTDQRFWQVLSQMVGQEMPPLGKWTQSPTPTPLLAEVCPPPWENFPDWSKTIVGGMILLPQQTRVIGVDSAPGEAEATLCTQGATATIINELMAQGIRDAWLA